MKERNCFCALCHRSHLLEMENEEFRMMVALSQETVNEKGELKIACNDCVPFKYSGACKSTDSV